MGFVQFDAVISIIAGTYGNLLMCLSKPNFWLAVVEEFRLTL